MNSAEIVEAFKAWDQPKLQYCVFCMDVSPQGPAILKDVPLCLWKVFSNLSFKSFPADFSFWVVTSWVGLAKGKHSVNVRGVHSSGTFETPSQEFEFHDLLVPFTAATQIRGTFGGPMVLRIEARLDGLTEEYFPLPILLQE